ncbi:glycoside hydrolase family 78 protein [Poritiphilus flavus]|uniref:Fibronectin type-III domain-containing protein n=1 Tax=Poritiphilus flavus TaxID=2697053 RepID=A0A6L9EJI4_9FLAO|nr:fibronectin type III domain-containing protein [Poritiphilus flavus]NAS14349.1 hypothetical protein [Poritiphilus flavus]
MKKTLIYLMAPAMMMFGCGGSGNGEEPDVDAPTVPALTFPTANLACTHYELEFQWEASTDEGSGTISYQIDVSEDSSFGSVDFSDTVSSTTATFTLEPGTTYYWRVSAQDGSGNESSYSPSRTFYTEPEAGTNSLPTIPEIGLPALGSTVSGSMVELSWQATDADGDELLYDIYFGAGNPPELYTTDVEANKLEVAVAAGTQYYWRVVAKDARQGVSKGRLWHFRVE